MLPPAILNPAWQLRLAAGLIGSAFLPLLGLCLFHLWRVLPYADSQPRRFLMNFTVILKRLAVLATLGFLLLLPLQARAGWELINTNFRAVNADVPSTPAQRRFDAMKQAIRQAPDAARIQRQLTILRGPVIAAQDMRKPLPELRGMLLQALAEARHSVGANSQRQNATRVAMLLQECMQNSLSALAYAIGFAAFAQRPPRTQAVFGMPPESLLEEVLAWIKRKV
ncbi:MAG: hypothetical protein ACK5N0_00325 [Synechococcaceae cyanobacterium]